MPGWKTLNISPAKLTKYPNEASGGTSMVSRNEVCRDLAGHYLPEWSYVRSNYLGPIQEISQKFLAEEVIAKGRRLYAAAEKVTVPRVPKYRHRQDESFSRVMAPLLAGFSVPAIVVLATSNGLNSPWREIALAFLVMATGLFLASFQMVIGSVYIVRYDELRTTRYLISVLGIAFLDVALIVMVAAAIDNLWVFLALLVLVLGSVVVPVVLRLKTHRD